MTRPSVAHSTHQEALQRLGAFALAQVFRPHEAAHYAAQVLLPAWEVLPADCQTPARAWISVEALVTRLGPTVSTSLYEVYEARLVHRLLGISQGWPTLWREALTVYFRATFGVDLSDAAQCQAVDDAAARARWEASQALYGSPHTRL
jgi:hypothetical protein